MPDSKLSPRGILRGFKSSPLALKVFEDISTPQLSDALKSVTGNDGVIKSIKPINNLRVSGRVFTAMTSCGDWGTSVMAIDAAKPGDVLFIRTDADDKAVWGELTSKSAMKKGISGAVIYGSCRDIDVIRGLDFPVFSRDFLPCAGDPLAEGTLDQILECDGVTVKTGDFLLGDESGVVVVPAELIGDVARESRRIKEKETFIKGQIKKDRFLSEVLGLKP